MSVCCQVAEKWFHSYASVSGAVHRILDALMYYTSMLLGCPPPLSSYGSHALTRDNRAWPHFRGYIGALDWSHIPVYVTHAEQASNWKNRKGWSSQIVLAAVDFEENIVSEGATRNILSSRCWVRTKEPSFASAIRRGTTAPPHIPQCPATGSFITGVV